MRCDEFLAMLNEVLDGDSFCEDLETHLAACEGCRVVVDTVRRTITLYRGSQAMELPWTFRERLHREIQSRWEAAGPQP